MEKQFIPYELELKLKELGFNEPCLRENTTFHYSNDEFLFSKGGILWQQAFDWFREQYNIEVNNRPVKKSDFDKTREISFYIDGTFISNLRFTIDGTYQEAQLACLNKLIEIISSETD